MPSPSQPFTITRTFAAPRALVWQAWTQREHLMRWFSPKGMTKTSSTIDLRPGGFHHYGLRMPDGKEIWGKWIFREVTPPERMVWVQFFSDAQGGRTRHPLAPGWPIEMLSVATFSETAGKTTVTLEMVALNATPSEQKVFDDAHGSMRGGWTGTFDQLDTYLPETQADAAMDTGSNSPVAEREIVLSRELDAPRELVWRAFTDPAQVVRWWGPDGFTTTIKKMDFRVGGEWTHTMHGPDGTDHPNYSIFREIVTEERISYGHGGGRKGGPGAQFEATWTFESLGPKRTRVTGRMVFPTAAARDLVVREYGAIEGGKQTLARLATYLANPA